MTSNSNSSVSDRFFRPLVLGVAALLCLAPISSPSLWWEICRGQTVCDGIWNSSATRIHCEELPDSDVLAGVIPWLAFDVFGVNGLMILKLAAVAVLASLLIRQCRNASHFIIPIGVMIACVPAFDPDHRVIDLLGIVVAWHLASTQRLWLLALVAVSWCNYSIGAVWCAPVIWLAMAASNQTARQVLMTTLLAVCSLSVNPRGPMALIEMLRFAAPFAFYDSDLLARSGFGFASLTVPSLYSACLCIAGILHPTGSLATKATVLVCGLMSIANSSLLPTVGLIAGLTLMTLNRRSESQNWVRLPRGSRVLNGSFAAAAIVSVVVLMSGGIRGEGERFGWGMADRLDHRLVDRDVNRYAESRLLAHCSSTSAAGLLLAALPKAEVLDVAEVAIKRGRFEDFAMLNYDLSTGRKTAYARSDGNMGGWWNSLINGNVDLLAISADHTPIFTALEPTLWKPLALDSPVIVLGQAGSRLFTRQIINVRDQRDVVDLGAWNHQLLNTTGNGSHTDLWQILTGSVDSRADIRQAGVFRSMGILNAAARTMLPVVGGPCRPDGSAEFLRIQQEFLWLEKLHCGSHSRWRLAVLQFLGDTSWQKHSESLLADAPPESSATIEFPLEAIRLYCSGQPELAAKMIKTQGVESLFAVHSLYWQAGIVQQAEHVLERMRAGHVAHPLTLAAEWERGILQ